MNTRLLFFTVAATATLTVASCKPEVSRVTWEPIDPVASQQLLANPDGDIDYALSEEFMIDLDENMPQIIQTLDMFAGLMYSLLANCNSDDCKEALDTDAPVDTEYTQTTVGQPPAPEQTSRDGTNLYLRKECPIDTSDTYDPYDTDATLPESGELRLDITGLESFELESITSNTDFLLQANDCLIGDAHYSTECAGWLDDSDDFLMLLDMIPLGISWGNMVLALLEVHPRYIHLLVGVESHGSYRLGVSLGVESITIDITAADGTAKCTWEDSGKDFINCTTE